MTKRASSLAVLAACIAYAVVSPVTFGENLSNTGNGTQPVEVARDLPLLIDINWRKGPDLPIGFQDSDGGIIHGMLISVCGFGRGHVDDVVAGKEGKYPRESHLKNTFALNLNAPSKGWVSLPAFPAVGRKELFGINVGNDLYVWGGSEYNFSYTFKDGYRLSNSGSGWTWEKLPDLPLYLGSSGIAAIGSKIYVMGGSQYYLRGGGEYLTNIEEHGSPLGALMMEYDTAAAKPEWKQLPPCPGTPRGVQAMAAVGGKIYVLGGAAGENNPSGVTCTVVDNWRFDPATEMWERLADLPIASGSFPSGKIVFQDRYILMIGGYQYTQILNPDGTNRPVYGQPTRHDAGEDYFSDVFVYDTQTNTFGKATPLPLNIRLPMTVIKGNQIHLVGGETPGFELDGERYGHNPELYLIGDLKVADQ